MPRNNDLSNLGNLGPGQVPNGAVEDVSLKNPQRDTLPLSAHVNDPSRAHMASSIGIVDAGGFYSSDEVEGALQEIGGAFGGGRQNGILTGFGYSALGLTVTFDTPSTALMPTVKDYSGESIALPDNTPSIWVYISPATGLITQFVGANPPTITSPENVLLWQFTTLGGAITVVHDARFYVRNIDRKLPLTVRASGPQADQESEACFVTLDAALTYLKYAVTLSSLRTEVIVRGVVTTGPIDLPVNGIHFRGEDGGTIVLTSGAYLFDTKGKDDVTFSDLGFQTNVAGATAVIDTVGTSLFLSLTRCSISSGTSPWQAGIFLANSTGTLRVSNSSISVTDTGISAGTPNGLMVEHTSVTAINFVGGSLGVRVGVSPTTNPEKPSSVRSCLISGFDTGVWVSGIGHIVSGCSITVGSAGAVGIDVREGQEIIVSENRIDCLTNSGKIGIRAVGTTAAQVTGLKVVSNTVIGAADWGIRFFGFVQESTIIGNVVDCYLPASPEDPTAKAGIQLQAFGGASDVPAYVTISGNVIWRAKAGIYVVGATSQELSEVVISSNEIHHCAVGVAGVPAAYETSAGIYAMYCKGISVQGNNIYGIGSILKPDGTVVQPTPANVFSTGITLENCDQGTVQNNKVRELTLKGVSKGQGIFVTATGASLLTLTGSVVSGNAISAIPGVGILYGIGAPTAAQATVLTGALVSENSISSADTGISVYSLGRSTIVGLSVSSNVVDGTLSANGIEVVAAAAAGAVPDGVVEGAEVTGNTVLKSGGAGISLECGVGASLSGVRADRNVVTLPGLAGILFTGGDLVGFNAPNVFGNLGASGNQVTMNPAIPNTQGIGLSGVANSFSGLTVSDNTISDSYNGIKVLLTGPGASDMVADSILVSRNSLTGVRNDGIAVGVQGTLSQSDFTKNRIFNTVGSSQCLFLLIAKTVASAAQSSDILIADNLLRPISGVTAITVGFIGMKTQNLRVEGNDVQGGLYGTLVTLTSSATGVVPSINGLSVRGNTYALTEWQGVVVTVPSASDEILNVDVSGNTFNQVAEDVGSVSSAAILMTLQNTSRNLAVRDNQFYSCGRVGGTDGGITLKLNGAVNVGVTGNQFSGGSTGADYGFGNSVVIKGNAPGGFSLKDVDVSKNMVRNTSLGVIATLRAHIALDLANFSSAFNISVDGNDIDRDPGTSGTDCVGVAVWGSAVDYYGLRVNDNRVSGADLGTPLTQTAISLLVNSIDQGSVSNNYVSGTSVLGTQGSGITVAATSTSRALSVSNNKVVGETGVSGAGNYGISVSVSSGALNGSFVDENYVYGYPSNISVDFTSSTILSVSNNESGSYEDYGIFVESTGAGGQAANLTVDGNVTNTNADAQTSGIFVTTSGSNSFENLSVCNNQVRYNQTTGADVAAGVGIKIESAVDIDNASISRNNVFTVGDGITVVAVNSYGVSIDDNNTQEGYLGIASFAYGGIIGYSVSRNRVRCRADSTRGGLIYINYNASGFPLQNATIDGNNVDGGLTVPTFTWGGVNAITVGTSGAEPNAISVSISGNTIRLSGNGIITEFLSSRALAVDRNKVDRLKRHGIKVLTATTGDSSEISLSGNLVSRWQQEASGTLRYGVAVSTGTTGSNTMFGVSLVGNNVKGDESSSIGYDLDLPSHNLRALVFSGNTSMLTGGAFTTALSLATGAGTIRNMSFTNNVFRGSTAGISYSAGAGIPQFNCVMGNIGDQAGSWSQFANGGAAGWLTGIPIVTDNFGAGVFAFGDVNKDDGT